jgi:hypothetical protein
VGDLDSVIAMALRMARRVGYQSGAALADDLRRYLDDERVSARPDSLAYRARKFVHRNRTAVTLGTATVVALVGATAFSVVQMRDARAQRNEVMRSARRAMAMAELQGVLAGDTRDPDGRPLTTAGRIGLAEQVLEPASIASRG